MSSPSISVVGAPDLAARVERAGEGERIVVVGGPVRERVAWATRAVSAGAHAFLLWPPAADAGAAETLAARAEEAGVEVGVERPLGAGAALAGVPDGWAARLITLSLVAPLGGRLAAAGWPTLLAGALDVCTSLAAARDVTRLDAVAEREPQADTDQADALRAVALAARFENGAYAQAVVRFSDHADTDEVALYASRPGSRVEARSLTGPLCVEAEGHPAAVAPAPPDDAEAAEIEAFARAVAARQPAPYPLHRALATLRLAARVQDRLR